MKPADALYSFAHSFALKKAAKDSDGVFYELPTAQKITMGTPENKKFNVGFASCDITPTDYKKHPYWMAGYNIAKRITGLLDPLTASAMWIDCGTGEGIVLVSCDLIGLTGYDVNEIRASLSQFCVKTGCKHITISCTHTHAGVDTMGYWGVLPKSGKDKAYMLRIKNSVIALCEEAYANRKSGDMFYGYIDAPELLHRWRAPYFSKAVLHRFRFVPDDGSTETWYLNFPAHPNTLGGRNKLMSADYPCYMRREINRHQNVNIMYAISAIGATDIGKVADDNVERTILGGSKLGLKALEISNERKLDAVITVVSQNFVLPVDNFVLSLANSLGIFSGRRCAADSKTKTGLISEVTYFNIGGIQILTMPGEMFPELVWSGGYEGEETSSTGESADVNPTPLSEIFNDDNIMIFGVTNDMAGYALARNDYVLDTKMAYFNRGTDRFGRSHYHETNSCGINTGDAIEGACRQIKSILDKG